MATQTRTVRTVTPAQYLTLARCAHRLAALAGTPSGYSLAGTALYQGTRDVVMSPAPSLATLGLGVVFANR